MTDTNILINLIHVDRLALLGALSGYEFVVPPEVESELTIPPQANALAGAFDAGHLHRRPLESTTELALYASHVQVVGKGEAACLAMAEVHGWSVASDERRRFKTMAVQRLGTGRILNTPGLYVLAIRSNLISVEEADRDRSMRETNRFAMRFSSFGVAIPFNVAESHRHDQLAVLQRLNPRRLVDAQH